MLRAAKNLDAIHGGRSVIIRRARFRNSSGVGPFRLAWRLFVVWLLVRFEVRLLAVGAFWGSALAVGAFQSSAFGRWRVVDSGFAGLSGVLTSAFCCRRVLAVRCISDSGFGCQRIWGSRSGCALQSGSGFRLSRRSRVRVSAIEESRVRHLAIQGRKTAPDGSSANPGFADGWNPNPRSPDGRNSNPGFVNGSNPHPGCLG